MRTTSLLGSLVLTLLLSSPAAAQAPGATPAPAPADPAPAATEGWDGVQTWGIGLRTTGKSLGPADDETGEESVDLGGGGLTVRYRLSQRWELDLAIEHTEAELYEGALTRHSSGATLSVLYHMRPDRAWDWYVLAGLGGTEERFVKQSESEEVFSQAHVHLGLGLERRFSRFGLGAELRLIGAGLDPEAGDAPLYMEGAAPVPEESSGAQLNLTATYYF